MALALVVAGQAGHGKTSLIRALGLAGPDAVPADRRPLVVIDPDGHDDLVVAMLAAVPVSIAAHLLVAAADEAITPDTREAGALLRALGVGSGIAVVTRAELADPTGVLQELGQLVPSTSAHAVSLETGDGLDALRRALASLLAGLPSPVTHPAARFAGDGPPAETSVIDAALDFGPHREREPDHGARAVVHLLGGHAPARLARLGGRFWQIRLDRPLPAAAGDRFVVRRADPPVTLGGGIVLDPAASRHPTSNEVIVRLTRISRGQPPLPPDPPRRPRR